MHYRVSLGQKLLLAARYITISLPGLPYDLSLYISTTCISLFESKPEAPPFGPSHLHQAAQKNGHCRARDNISLLYIVTLTPVHHNATTQIRARTSSWRRMSRTG